MCSSPAASSRRAGRSSPSGSRPRATSGTPPEPARPGSEPRSDSKESSMDTITPSAPRASGEQSMNGVPALDVATVRADFPIFERQIHGRPLVYLDSANTSQKPHVVIDALRTHYELHNANVARSVHTLGTEATLAYESARAKVAAFIGAAGPDEVVFAKNSTEAINLVAYAFGNASATPATRDLCCVRVTRSSSPRWSTTPTSSRGSCCASGPARRSSGSASRTTAGSTCRGSTR